jgi:hypothetical protein
MRLLAALVVGMTLSGTSLAADRVILGRLLDVRDPSGAEADRRVTISGKESATDVPAISDPTSGGATLTVIANGGSSSSETYTLDPSGWTATGSGYRYRGPTGPDADPVRSVTAKRTAGGVAMVKVLLRGNSGTQPLGVVPPNPGDDGGFILDVAGGDRYCVTLGGAAGGTEQKDGATQWKVKRATAEAGCPAPPTTSSTTSTTTSTITTTTGPPFCGNDIIDPGEQCDGTALPVQCSGFACELPGGARECQCCGIDHCSPIEGITSCCGEGTDPVACADEPGHPCYYCGPGGLCGRFPSNGMPERACCQGAVCLKVVVAVQQVRCCMPLTGTCVGNADCCTDFCDGVTSTCQCAPAGHACFRPDFCCSGSCPFGVCN